MYVPENLSQVSDFDVADSAFTALLRRMRGEEGVRQYRFAFADCRRGGCDYFVHQLRRFIQKERALDLQGGAHCLHNSDFCAYVYAVRRDDHGSNRREGFIRRG